MSVVDEIKERLDVAEVVGDYVHLEKSGRNYRALCPFHTEKTPSFYVFPDSQRWHCFGACSTGGDIFNFVMRHEGMDFPEALRLLAERAGVQLTPLDDAEMEARDERQRLFDAHRMAAEFYHHLLMQTEAGRPGLEYLERRGVTRQTMARFQLGFAPDDWHVLDNHLRAKGVSQEDALSGGLLSKSERGAVYDRFRGRVLFPIRDARGRTIGFGGRVLDDSLPKYLNSPQTSLFDKSSVLYGIDMAREAIRTSGTAVIVEGYMDVVIPHQCGVTNVVACMGTALTEAHMDVLKRMVDRLILALDPDAAGLAAVEKGVAAAEEALEHRVVPVPTPQGLIRYEQRLDAEIRILTLPDGLDPDELILQDRDRWDELVEAALPVADHLFQRAQLEIDVSTGKGKRQAAERLLPVIAAIPSLVEREHHLQRLARWLRVDERRLWDELRRLDRSAPGSSRSSPDGGSARVRSASPSRPAPLPQVGGVRDPVADLEEHVLGLVLAYPDLVSTLAETLGDGEVFGDVRNRQVFETLSALGDGGGTVQLPELEGALDSEIAARVESLRQKLQAAPPLEPDLVREDLIKSATRLRKHHLGRLLRDLCSLQETAQEGGPEEQVRELSMAIDRLRCAYRETDVTYYAATLVGRSKRGIQS